MECPACQTLTRGAALEPAADNEAGLKLAALAQHLRTQSHGPGSLRTTAGQPQAEQRGICGFGSRRRGGTGSMWAWHPASATSILAPRARLPGVVGDDVAAGVEGNTLDADALPRGGGRGELRCLVCRPASVRLHYLSPAALAAAAAAQRPQQRQQWLHGATHGLALKPMLFRTRSAGMVS